MCPKQGFVLHKADEERSFGLRFSPLKPLLFCTMHNVVETQVTSARELNDHNGHKKSANRSVLLI